MRLIISCRAPHGARGLKPSPRCNGKARGRRAPHGARGLKQHGADRDGERPCRAPHGARGLKHYLTTMNTAAGRRAPHGARGLKQRTAVGGGNELSSRPARGAWIETVFFSQKKASLSSRPARGAWIETTRTEKGLRHIQVAPRTGRVA